MFSVRNPQYPELQDLVAELGAGCSAGLPEQAIESNEVVVFAIPGAAMSETIRRHPALLAGKVVIDAANRTDGVMNSAADFAAHAPGARYSRAFNSLGWENFENPLFGGVAADLFYSGAEGEGAS